MPRADKTHRADRRYGAGAHTAQARRALEVSTLVQRIEAARGRRDRAARFADRSTQPGERRAAAAGLLAAEGMLDVAVMAALAHRRGPTDDAVAAAAGLSAYEIAHARDRLRGRH